VVRTQGVGLISRELAQEVGVSGPLLRGSGFAHDLRRVDPYSSYEDYAFDVPVETAGDCFGRYRVRMQEFRQAMRIVRQALDGLPAGPISSRPGVKSIGQVKLPKGEAYARVESPRREAGLYLVSDGSTKPYRMKWRGASFSNLAVAGHILPGHKIADAVAILGSIDPVFREVGRSRADRDALEHRATVPPPELRTHDRPISPRPRAEVRRAAPVPGGPLRGRTPARVAPADRRRGEAPPEGGHRSEGGRPPRLQSRA